MIKAYAEQMLGESYKFPSYHRAIREPFDYYQVDYFSHTHFSLRCTKDGERLYWIFD